MCPICREECDGRVVELSCAHKICKECLVLLLESSNRCPLCRGEIQVECLSDDIKHLLKDDYSLLEYERIVDEGMGEMIVDIFDEIYRVLCHELNEGEWSVA